MFKLNEERPKEYLQRIGYNGPKVANLEALNNLHEQHVFAIAFEGLSVHMGQSIKLDLESIYDKLVIKQRGGYCYEMNGLFYEILKYLGFKVNLHLGEVVYNGSPFRSRVPRHSMLIVTICDDDYLVDVGYGRNGLIKPLKLTTNTTQSVYSSHYRVLYNNKDGYLYQFKINGEFQNEYRFDPLKNKSSTLGLKDLEPHNHWVSTSADSSFVKHIIITQPTKSGKISITDNIYRTISEGKSEKSTIVSLEQYSHCLQKFDIKLKPEFLSLIWDKIQGHKIRDNNNSINALIAIKKQTIFHASEFHHGVEEKPSGDDARCHVGNLSQ